MLTVTSSPLEPLLPWRDQYRAAMAVQIVHDSWHRRGYTTLLRIDEEGVMIGYAALGGYPGEPHETVKEFYLVPEVRSRAEALFAAVLAAAQPRWLEAQTNDPFLSPLLPRFAPEARPHTHLFAEGPPSHLPPPWARLRQVRPEEHATVFPHTTEPIGEWGLELDGELVATGGLFYHYNPPFGDIYMEVALAHQRQRLASYLVQELKRIGREDGYIPAARCNLENVASRRALENGGMVWCGQIVRGPVST